MALDISDACMQTCAAGIKAMNPNLEGERLLEELRRRVEWMKRNRGGKRGLRAFEDFQKPS